MFAQAILDGEKDHAQFFQVFLDLMVNHFRIILGACPSQELPLCFWDPQAVKSFLDRIGNIIPRPAFAVSRL